MNTTQLKDFALLAEASYAHFETGDYQSKDKTKIALSTYASMNNATFSAKQAELFTNDYTLLHQSQEGVPSGFSATVFKDNANPNRLVLSFRGTEFVGDAIKDLLLTDITGIGGYGYAIQQALPLYRYIRQLQTVAGQKVNYTEAEIEKMFALSFGSIITSTVRVGRISLRNPPYENLCFGEIRCAIDAVPQLSKRRVCKTLYLAHHLS